MWTTWNAFPHLDRLIDDVMSGAAGTASGAATSERAYSPAIDIRTNPQEIVFLCDVPGLSHEDIDVSIEKDTLTIEGRRRYEGSEKDHVWLGRSYGKFSRSFKLPELVDAEKLEASLQNGVLTVRVPRREKEQPRRIQVAVGGKDGSRPGDAAQEPGAGEKPGPKS